MEGLRKLLGSSVTIRMSNDCGRKVACALPFPLSNERTVKIPPAAFTSQGLLGGAQWIVHELAHVIDWRNGFSGRWPYAPLTEYAETAPVWGMLQANRWEVWAEAVTVYVFGGFDVNGAYTTSYERANWYPSPLDQLNEQMRRMQYLLNGWF